MPDSLIVLCLVLGLVATGFVLRALRLKRVRESQQLGLICLGTMAGLLSHLQQHRGLCNGYLSGGSELERDIAPLQSAIRRDIAGITDSTNWISSNPDWKAIIEHWQRLSTGYREKDKEASLREHNALIQCVLFLIDDMAQAHHLLMVQKLELLWRELLTATEYIGQARAIGTGLSATGYCDSVSRIRLHYLCLKIHAATERVWQDLDLSTKDQAPVDRLVNCIQEKLLQDGISISPKEFFEIASQAIDSLQHQYRKKLDQHYGMLAER